jgi:hypothetical protein
MIATTTLARVDNEWLQRGVEGLTVGAYSITLRTSPKMRCPHSWPIMTCRSYNATLTATRAFCGCGDSMFRGKTCKHSVALALYVIRTPETERRMETDPAKPHTGKDPARLGILSITKKAYQIRFCANRFNRAGKAWMKGDRKDLRRAQRLLESADHFDVANKRFTALIEDHLYWHKRWTEADLNKQKSKA